MSRYRSATYKRVVENSTEALIGFGRGILHMLRLDVRKTQDVPPPLVGRLFGRQFRLAAVEE